MKLIHLTFQQSNFGWRTIRKSKLFFTTITVALLTSCATPYQPKSFTGGFSEIQLDQNTVRVTFNGNAKTPRETVETYMLYRCAEVTLEYGFDYFILLDNVTDVQHGAIVSPGTYQSSTNVSAIGPNYATATTTGTYTPGTVTPYQKFGTTATINLFKGVKPTNLLNAYSAQELKGYLEPHIKRN